MSICPSCNGVIGQDCFNPGECMAITQAMAERSVSAEQEIQELWAEVKAKDERIKELESALKQAADLIAIPASYHDAGQAAQHGVTGLPRFSVGAQIHNKECAELLPILKAALVKGGG